MKKVSAKLEIPPREMVPILKSLTPSQRLTTILNLSKMFQIDKILILDIIFYKLGGCICEK